LNKTVVLSVPTAAPSGRPNPFFRKGSTKMVLTRPKTHSLMAPMYWACADLLLFASQAAQGAVSVPAPDLRRQLGDLIAAMFKRGAASGIAPEDLENASYAIVALFDEILVRMNWPGRQEWQANPLQFLHFRENTAGDNFFRRAEALCIQPHRAHVLQIYFLCLALGFQGRYAMGNIAECEAFYQKAWLALLGSTLLTDQLSPHGIPRDAGRTLLQRQAPIARLGLACFVFACLVFLIFRIVRSVELSHVLGPMRTYASTSAPNAPKP
jgi:type VI secretion system protein ImpK